MPLQCRLKSLLRCSHTAAALSHDRREGLGVTLPRDSPTLAALTLHAYSPLPSACSSHEQNGLSVLLCLYLSSTPQLYQLAE